MTEQGPVYKKRGIGDWWNELAKIKSLCEIPNINITRLLRLMDMNQLLHETYEAPKNKLTRVFAERANIRRYRRGAPIFRVAPVANRYTVFPAHVLNDFVIPSVVDLVDETTDAVVELGCGFGRQIFQIRDILEHEFPNLRYFGGDISPSGLEAAELVHGLEPSRAPISFFKFDYQNATFEMLKECKRVVVFTSHSIEQVKFIDLSFFETLLTAVPDIKCFHVEPVGWQLNDALMRMVEDGTFGKQAVNISLHGLLDDFHSASMPIASGWNRNLLSQLFALAGDGRIKIEFIEKCVSGDQPYNPSTHIYWTRRA